MLVNSISIALIIAAATLLSACGAINSSLSEAVTDTIPHWAGSLPVDAPPRATDPKYAEYLEKLQAKAVVDAPKADASAEIKPR
jgi:ABC-type glycerol-3-phosphate transport system substrate-binding protein